MQSNLYIPKTIKVGFQERNGTFTGKLAYIVYIDEKGVTRKEKSWNGWRDKNIDVLEIDNTPRNNYVFNKGIQRCSHHFGSGRSVIRVYDPRDFEFEISVDNLIGILMHSDVSKRDIVEDCVFAWAGKDLVLLPVNSEEYKSSVEYTKKQSKKVSARDLKQGFTYVQKKNPEPLVYIGYHMWYADNGRWATFQQTVKKGKKHVFYDTVNDSFVIPTIGTFAECISEEIHNDFPNIVDKFVGSINSAPITGFTLSKINISKTLKVYNKGRSYKSKGTNFFRKENDKELSNISIHSYSLNCKEYKVTKSDIYVKLMDSVEPSNLKTIEEERTSHYSYYSRNEKTEHQIRLSTLKEEVFGENEDLTKEEFLNKLHEIGYKTLYQTREDKIKFSV